MDELSSKFKTFTQGFDIFYLGLNSMRFFPNAFEGTCCYSCKVKRADVCLSKMATIDRRWIAQNLEKYNELLQNKPTECPICYESFNEKEADSPLLSDVPTTCTHWLCKECWQNVAGVNAECPICRTDLSPWLLKNSGLTNRLVQQFLVSVMCMQGGSGRAPLNHDQMFEVTQKLFRHSFS